jgi:hypothetical protein
VEPPPPAGVVERTVEAGTGAQVDELEDFADQGAALQRLTIDDVRAFRRPAPASAQYIEITVLPR